MVDTNDQFYREDNLLDPRSRDGGVVGRIWRFFNVIYFQYTVIFGIYMMNGPERIIFNSLVILALVATTYYSSQLVGELLSGMNAKLFAQTMYNGSEITMRQAAELLGTNEL